MNEPSFVPLEAISAEAVASLSSEEYLKRIQSTVKPYVPHSETAERSHNLHTLPISVPASRVFLRPVLHSSRNTARTPRPDSKLGELPNEILLNVAKFMDIASLVRFAASSSGIRRLVLSMPHVRIVKSNAAATLALSQMLRAGTAKYFSLEEFIDTITTSACMICKDPSTFAPWLCLLLCHRTCVNCISTDQQTIRMPKSMALKCLGLSEEDIAGEGSAYAILQPSFCRSQVPSEQGLVSSRIIRRENKIAIVSLKHVLALAEKKYAADRGTDHVKLLIERYLREHHPEIHAATVAGNSCEVTGLCHAIKNEWGKGSPSQDWVLMADMPYLTATMPPSQFEKGVLCEGCARDAHHAPTALARSAAREAANKVYLVSQYADHLNGCETARSIFRGERLNMTEEQSLKICLHKAVSRFESPSITTGSALMAIVDRVQLNARPTEVRAAIKDALRQIQHDGNRNLQQRTAATWQTPR